MDSEAVFQAIEANSRVLGKLGISQSIIRIKGKVEQSREWSSALSYTLL